MKPQILHYEAHGLDKTPYQQQVWDLLRAYGDQFVPPLSQRSGTLQRDLRSGGETDGQPTAYFEALREQDFLLAVDARDKLLGFLSFRKNHAVDALGVTSCVYVSTILVREDARKHGIAEGMYRRLLSGADHSNKLVCTRTWSDNTGHLALLDKLGFELGRDIPNDRGEGIDTVYYQKSVDTSAEAEGQTLTRWQKFKAYKLNTSIYALLLLLAGSVAAVVAYYVLRENGGFWKELTLAVATSLLASASCIGVETYINYRARRNDKLLEGLQAFGIGDLHFNKQQLILDLLRDCGNYLWVSGCRMILTRKIAPAIARQLRVRPDLKVRCLICPPWTRSYQLIYSKDEPVIDNYFAVFRMICQACGDRLDRCEVRIIDKPLFNDTYKIDKTTVTGPFLHARDASGGRITAGDFFTYDVIRQSRLQALMEREYATLWDEATETLDLERFQEACARYRADMTEEEKCELLKTAVVPVDPSERASLLSRVEAEYAKV